MDEREVMQYDNADLHDEDHFLFELSCIIVFGADLPIKVQHFLQCFVLAWHDELDDRHEKRRLLVHTFHQPYIYSIKRKERRTRGLPLMVDTIILRRVSSLASSLPFSRALRSS
jgi:hypothetical protein